MSTRFGVPLAMASRPRRAPPAVPMLYVIGQNDALLGQGRDLYAAIGSQNKVMVEVECASHYLNWETRHKILHRASKHFLRHNSFEGVAQGILTVTADGTIMKQ